MDNDVKKAARECAEEAYPEDCADDRGICYLGFLSGAAWQRERDLKVCDATAAYHDSKSDLAAARGALHCGQTIRATACDDSQHSAGGSNISSQRKEVKP